MKKKEGRRCCKKSEGGRALRGDCGLTKRELRFESVTRLWTFAGHAVHARVFFLDQVVSLNVCDCSLWIQLEATSSLPKLLIPLLFGLVSVSDLRRFRFRLSFIIQPFPLPCRLARTTWSRGATRRCDRRRCGDARAVRHFRLQCTHVSFASM